MERKKIFKIELEKEYYVIAYKLSDIVDYYKNGIHDIQNVSEYSEILEDLTTKGQIVYVKETDRYEKK